MPISCTHCLHRGTGDKRADEKPNQPEQHKYVGRRLLGQYRLVTLTLHRENPIFTLSTTHKSKDKVHRVLESWYNSRVQSVCTWHSKSRREKKKKQTVTISKSSHTELSTAFSLISSGPSNMRYSTPCFSSPPSQFLLLCQFPF